MKWIIRVLTELRAISSPIFGYDCVIAETVGFLLLNHFGFLLSLFYFAFSATENKHGENLHAGFYEWQTERKSTKQPKN